MEISVVGCSQAKMGKISLQIGNELGFSNCRKNKKKKDHLWFDLTQRCPRAAIQVSCKATHSRASLTEKTTIARRSRSAEDVVQLFVGLPLDGVSDCNTLKNTRAIAAGLKALKLLGVEGVDLPVWWGIVEKESMGKYDWSGYIALAKMVEDVGLKLRVFLCFHASKEPVIPLPQWVSQIGESQPDIFFADRSGKRYKDCLSLAIDELPVLDGKSPLQVYQGLLESFKSSFSSFMGSTITDISVGLGPNGELRYPSYPSTSNKVPGAGEFQCYDQHMLNNLKQHSQAIGNPNWGLTGPHDAPTYHQLPNSSTFFKDNGGSWDSPYGHFFLSWYSSQLISHGDRILSLASTTFSSSPVTISGKVPLVHFWYKMQSHPSELTAGYYNTNAKDGYDPIVEVFARNSCKIVLPGMDLADRHQPRGSFSSPESLLSQIKTACGKHDVQVSGENSNILGAPDGFDQIKRNLSAGNVLVDSFTYQRMGAYFFSPKHFPSFTEFARSLNQPETHPDDMASYEEQEEPINGYQLQEA